MTKKKKLGISIKVSLKIRKALEIEEYDVNIKTSKEIMRVFQPFKGVPIEHYNVPSSKITYTKDDFTEEELEDPTNTDIIVTAKSLEFEIKKLDEKCAKIEGRIPKELRDKKNKMFCKKNILENMLGDKISPQQYAGMVHDSLEHHRKLLKYFQDHNEIEKEKIVVDRTEILIGELTEVLKLIQKQ